MRTLRIAGLQQSSNIRALAAVAAAFLALHVLDSCAHAPLPPPPPSGPSASETTVSARTQFLLQQHNARTPLLDEMSCIDALEKLLDSLTSSKYIFIGFSPERWATSGKQAQFVPYISRVGYRRQIVTVVIDDFCKVEGLIWPE